MERRELPAGWDQVILAELIDRIEAGKNFRCIERPPLNGEIGIVKVSAVSWGRFREEESKTAPSGVALDSETRIRQGDLLFSRANTIELVGACVMVESLSKDLRLSDKILRLVPSEETIKPWIYRYLSSPQARKYLSETSSGNQLSMRNISQRVLLETSVPLAPLNEQRRIAAKLDTTLAAVDACRQRLDGVAATLKRFRQAVLAAATSGELTREWREERGLADSWKMKFLSEIADSRLGKMLDQGKNTGQLTPYLRNINVRWFSFGLEDIQEIRLADKEIIDLDVRFGDLLVCEGGEPGRCAVWRREDSKYTFQKALHRVRTSKHLLADYLSFCLSNSANNGKLEQLFTGTTIKHLTGASLKKFQILLPSREEQEEIVDRVESLFTLADHLEARLTAARKVVDRLTPALLAKAFRGELVSQDPSDEPASVLLDRIRAARQAEAGAGKPSRRGRRQAAASPDPVALEAAPVPPDHLAALLKECGALSERALLAASELEPARFRAQLTLERQRGAVRDTPEDSGQVLLEASA